MIPNNPQLEENERKMNKAEEDIRINKEIDENFIKCSKCGKLTSKEDNHAGMCRRCYENSRSYSDKRANNYWEHMGEGNYSPGLK